MFLETHLRLCWLDEETADDQWGEKHFLFAAHDKYTHTYMRTHSETHKSTHMNDRLVSKPRRQH